MKTMKLSLVKRSRVVTLAIALTAMMAAHARALQINATTSPNLLSETGVAGAKYRLSQGNFDMSLDDGSGTTRINNQDTFIQKNLGNNGTLSGATFSFQLEHVAGQGFVFSMTSPASVTTTLAWGSGSSFPPSGPNVTSVETIRGNNAPSSFNALQLNARASRDPSYMAFEDLVFTSSATQTGTLVTNGRVGTGSIGSPASGPDFGTSVFEQWLIADGNLGDLDWTLSGKLTGARDSIAGGDETVRFLVNMKQVTLVPEPSTFAIAGLSGLAMLGYGLRRRKMARA
ncbi:PEP-CTERM sorting domain-containing protein [Tautonia sp. JC769]|uniref:PEP-CTERM sorting domain-containing protein n=1 Tax=Tautonia sp. JC769 TaxID=3232135 RepID=UPI00345B379B